MHSSTAALEELKREIEKEQQEILKLETEKRRLTSDFERKQHEREQEETKEKHELAAIDSKISQIKMSHVDNMMNMKKIQRDMEEVSRKHAASF